MKNKKTIIVSLYSLLLLFILVVSYGFITTTILGNNNSILNVFKSNPFTIVYTDSTNVISGDASDSFSPGSTITKSFTITNPKDSTLSFSIYLDNVTNTFTRKNDITYTLSLNGNDLKTGVFPSSKETIIYGQSIEPNETLNYTLTINYLNSEENQIVDSGAVIGAKLEFGFSEGFDNILVYGNSVQSRLPEGYTELEYIEGTGAQYIDTNVIANDISKIDISFSISGNTNDHQGIMGGGWTSNNETFQIIYNYNTNKISARYGGEGLSIDGDNLIHYVEMTNEKIIIDENEIQVSSTINDNRSVYLFARNTDNNGAHSPFSIAHAKIYNCEIYSNNEIVRNLIPAKNNSNVTGMYDLVNDIFYTNQGTGTFNAGSVVLPSPSNPIDIVSVGDKTNNLFNKKTAVDGYVFETGTITPAGSYEEMASDYIEIDISKTYTFQVFNATNNFIMIAFYDSNKDYITNSRTTTFATFITLSTIPSTAKYIRVSARQLQQSQVQAQLTADSTVTAYEPYGYKVPITIGNETTNLYLDEPLRKLGNYSDYIDFKNKKVYRYIAEDYITKDSSFSKFSYVTNYSSFYMEYNNLPNYAGTFKNYVIYSPTFTYRESGGGNVNSSWSGDYQISSAVAEGYKRVLFTLPNTITDVASAKNWLQSNPIKFNYFKKNVSEESIDVPDISTIKYSNNISVGTTLQPSSVVANNG